MNTYAEVGGEGGWKIWKEISCSLQPVCVEEGRVPVDV